VNRRTLLQAIPAAALLSAADLTGSSRVESKPAGTGDRTARSARIYELRVYHPSEGKLPELLARFRDHTIKLFEKHGIKSVAYWTPTDAPQKGNLLVYMLAHASREAADANWKAFREDAEWIAVKEKSEANGKLVDKIDSTF
jgi:NIPSNAP protein